MRLAIAALALALAGCGAPSTEKAPTPPVEGSAETATPAVVEPEALVGVWSFDRSCASGDGMRLNADATATFDEWGQGAWSLDAQDRVVLELHRQEPGLDNRPGVGPPVTYTLTVAPPVTDDLRFEITAPGEGVRTVYARRCPQ